MSVFNSRGALDHPGSPPVSRDEPVVASGTRRVEVARSALTVAERLVQTLEREGVRHVFGVAGGAILPFYEALSASSSITSIFNKREEGGAFMADGYARVRRGLGVCCATAAPGATNALTGIACAAVDSVPVLFISGLASSESSGPNGLQESAVSGIDMVDLYRPITRLSALVGDAESAGGLFDRAVRAAQDGRRGPVHLGLPVDVACRTTRDATPSPSPAEAPAASVDRNAIARSAQILAAARQPVILAGHGVDAADAADELRRFAEQLQIPVATTLAAKGVFPEDHPLSLGVIGTLGGHSLARSYLLGDAADVLLVIGSSLEELPAYGRDPRLFQGKTLIHIDIDGERIGASYPVDLAVVADARAALCALSATFATGDVPGLAARPQGLTALRAQHPRPIEAPLAGAAVGPIEPQRLIASLSRVLPDDALVFMDGGDLRPWLAQHHEVRRPHTFFTSRAPGSMGWALSAAIGGKLAAPDQPAVALMSDAAFLGHGVEIHTAVHHRIPVVCIVLDNGGNPLVEQANPPSSGHPVGRSRLRVPADLTAMARSLGAVGLRVETPAGFDDALAAALRSDRPCVLHVILDRSEIPALIEDRSGAPTPRSSVKTRAPR